MKLSRITQQNLSPSAKRPNHSADPNILLPVLAQIADSLPVRIRAHHGKAAPLIWSFGAAHVQEPCPIGQFNNVINMRSYANIFVLVRKHVFW
jgi:hypothetical protein